MFDDAAGAVAFHDDSLLESIGPSRLAHAIMGVP
jgi:hypothetical protein